MLIFTYTFVVILFNGINAQNINTGPIIQNLNTVEESKGFINTNDVTVIAFFADASSLWAKNYLESVDQMKEHNISFALTNEIEVFDFHGVKDDAILLFNSHINEKKIFMVKPFNWKAIVNFVLPNSLPPLIEFEPKLVSRIISARKGALFVILNSDLEGFKTLKNIVEDIASQYHRKCYVVIVDTAKDVNENILNTLRVNPIYVPCLRYSPSWGINFIPKTDQINESNIRQFVEDSLALKAKRITWKKSEEIPIDWNANSVHILVGKNFYETISSRKFSLVQFYDPNIPECENSLKLWENLGKKLKSNKDVMIAKMDAKSNEVDNIWIFSYPTVILYKYSPLNGFKSHRYQTVEDFLGFLERHGLEIDSSKSIKEEL